MAENNKQQEIKIELTPEIAGGHYANLAVIAHTPANSSSTSSPFPPTCPRPASTPA